MFHFTRGPPPECEAGGHPIGLPADADRNMAGPAADSISTAPDRANLFKGPSNSFLMRVSPLPLLVLLLLSSFAFSNFELRKLDVQLTLNPDASAHATEAFRLFINGSQSKELYRSSMVYNDLSTWTDRTGISDLRTHISRAQADIENLRVRPQLPDACNQPADTCYGTITLDYDVYPHPSAGSGLLKALNYKPRTTRYSLQAQAFSFPLSKTGDIILPKEATLRVAVPDDATHLAFSRPPDNLAPEVALFRYDSKTNTTYFTGTQRDFVWTGETLSAFEVSYEREEPLDAEMLKFFTGLQRQIFGLFLSPDGLAWLLVALLALVSVLRLHALRVR